MHNKMPFKQEIVSKNVVEELPTNESVQLEESDPEVDDIDCEVAEQNEDVVDLENQLERNVAALFLKMSSILNIFEAALQEVIDQINQIYLLSQPLLHSSIRRILHTHCRNVDDALVNEIAQVVIENNVFLEFTSDDGLFKSYISREFSLVMPVEFVLENKQNVVYVPIRKMLQTLLSNREILEKTMSHEATLSEKYQSYIDGARFKDSAFLNEEEFRIALQLYIDNFEVGNPLGTSRKKHKQTAIYWTLGNLHSKYCSPLHAIQLALLCKANNIKDQGYAKILHPLIQDLVFLEQQGIYVEHLGATVKGRVLFVAADNLATYSLGEFFESFRVSQVC